MPELDVVAADKGHVEPFARTLVPDEFAGGSDAGVAAAQDQDIVREVVDCHWLASLRMKFEIRRITRDVARPAQTADSAVAATKASSPRSGSAADVRSACVRSRLGGRAALCRPRARSAFLRPASRTPSGATTRAQSSCH